ncbi:MAG: nucleotidyltransferase domain-containing protein [Bacilli bacterium]
MPFNQSEYVKNYNKENYKMYQFRIKKEESNIITFLDGLKTKNKFFHDMLDKEVNHSVLTICQIKSILKEVCGKYDINEIYLFGSYARGEANPLSDVDIYCEKGKCKTFIALGSLIDELEEKLGKKVDLVTIGSQMDPYFEEQMRKDLIKLC